MRPDTELRKAGAEWVGRCPFHSERTASFYVNPGKKVYHCHGCGVGGDVIDYVRARHALDFIGAVEWLAERFSVPLEYEEESPEVAARRRGEDRKRELLALTAAFYHRVLRESPQAEGARTYLTERGVSWEMAERFQLGFSADEHAVIAGARKRQFADRELEETGITRRGRSGPVDRMTGRLVFTLFDVRGRPIAFAGRRLPPDESGAKYVNSPESPLWHKGSTLYGLHLARTAIARAEEAIVVEGYTDVIGLVQAGYDNVVASMGTALTQPQLHELRKLARNVVLLFDADTAGSEAALRGLELAASDGPARARGAAPARLRPGRGRRGGPRGRRSHARRRTQRARLPRRARARRGRRRAAPTGATRPTRRCARSSATRRRRPSATSSCAWRARGSSSIR